MSYKTWQPASDYKITGVTIPALPFTLAAWVKPHLDPASGYIVLQLLNSDAVKQCRMNFRPGRLFKAMHYDGTNAEVAATAASALDAWHQVTCIFTSTTSRTIYVDGGNNPTPDTTSVASPAGASGKVFLGGTNEAQTIGGEDPACMVAHVAIWNIALSGGDIANLQTLYPTSVAAGNLISYWALDALPPDDTGTNNWDMTVTGTNATVDNSDVPPLSAGGSGGGSGATSKGMFRSFYKGVW